MNDSFLNRVMDVCGTTDLTDDVSIKELDSLARAEIIVAAEEELGEELTNKEIMALTTWGELRSLMTLKIGHARD